MFTHNPVEIPEVKTKNVDRKRFYVTPNGTYPSITTVLNVRKREGLAEWRNRVGHDVANYIARTAATRGTKVHHMCEDFLNNQECGLWSDKYQVAGRVDCIAEYNGEPSIIDFKTSRSERNDEYNESYYIQAAAYAEMFEERTGIEINQIVILVVTEDGTVQEFIKTKHDYLPLLVETVEQFVTEWERENEEVTAMRSDAGM